MSLAKQIVLMTGILALCLAGAFFYGSGSADGQASSEARGGAPAQVIVQPLEFGLFRRQLRAVGTGGALQSVVLFPASDGRVEEVLFEGGDEVAEGEIVVRLNDSEEQVSLEAARIEQAQLERTLERYDRLRDSGAVSDVTYSETQDQLQLARLQVRRAEIALEDRLVRAPFAGTIGITDLHPGDRVDTDTEIATLDDRSGILVDFRMPEEFANMIGVGDRITVSGWAMDDRSIEGEIAVLGSRIDPRTRTLAARARIANPERRLRPGASYSVELEIVGDEYPSIPEVAVLWSRDGSHVWLVEDGMPRQVFVEILRREKGRALVKGDLDRRDLVIVEGVQSVRPGRKVVPRRADEPQGEESGSAGGTT